MDLHEAMQALRIVEAKGTREQRESSRVVTIDGKDFWVEWFGPYGYWEDYIHQIFSIDHAWESASEETDIPIHALRGDNSGAAPA